MAESVEISQNTLDTLLKNFNAVGQLVSGGRLTCTRKDEKALVFEVNGRVVGNTNAEIMFNDLCKNIAGEKRNIIFDLKACPYLSSFFLGSIMELVLSLRKDHLKVIFCNTNEIIDDLIYIANIERLVTITPTVETAMSLLEEK